MRWILLSDSNYDEFKDVYMITLLKSGSKSLNENYSNITGKNEEAIQYIKDKIKNDSKKYKYPQFEQKAKDVKLHQFHTTFYSLFSSISHSSWNSGNNKNKNLINTKIYKFIVEEFVIDALKLCKEWINNKKYKELPDYMK